ncbi:MAG TPA: carboxypeptidase regulatory-like domain-containing protein, partial [Vicinamibacteria bacterium]|nr:carboxypeptidase regulatory-like domain-containing protein [Vicinamibacteria bacterium]
AQQTGGIIGRVTSSDGAVLPGVTVEARSNVLPGPRVTTTATNGEYRLPALPPGGYTLTFTFPGMQTLTRAAQVQLAQDTRADVTLNVGALEESVTVEAEVSLVDQETATLKTGISSDEIVSVPVGQEYRDLQKLIPAVQYTQDQTRGPSAGGSGQDNVYQFDGVNVTLPLFGTMSSEPASHDIAQVTVVRGGARAVDFDRSGGFTMDSVSKSGTAQWHAQASYQFQTAGMAADLNSGIRSRYEQDRSWINANLGGPVVKDKLYFYGSYFRPEKSRDNATNLYGELPDFDSTRNEGFGKLTFTPSQSLLLNLSYRDSKRVETGTEFLSNQSATTGSGVEFRIKIATADASWVIDSRSYATLKWTKFDQQTLGTPDHVATVDISTTPGARLDVNTLDTQGRMTVPVPASGQTAYNAFVQPLIDRYGYVQNGQHVGGGTVGFGSQFDDNDFFRDAGQLGYNLTLGSNVVHDLHAGVQYYEDAEDLLRSSNGWGLITVPGGRQSFRGTPIFYQAAFQQQGTGQAPLIHSEFHSLSFELNDTIKWGNWSLNAGLLMSRDTLYGQGLREAPGTLTGFTTAPGSKYKMYEVGFGKMLQPRLGATWSYNGKDTVYASYAKYNPAASSLPRAASWDRNVAVTINAYFDQNGVLFATDPQAASSGKLFVEDLTPRTVHEFMIGTARQFSPSWAARAYGRYRRGNHFWEDTNNNARIAFNPPAGIPRELYIPDLPARLAQIGSGSTYVIAELDGAYSRYYEATMETEWRDSKTFVRGSFTWSRYYG